MAEADRPGDRGSAAWIASVLAPLNELAVGVLIALARTHPDGDVILTQKTVDVLHDINAQTWC
jgi:hypothetical protein